MKKISAVLGFVLGVAISTIWFYEPRHANEAPEHLAAVQVPPVPKQATWNRVNPDDVSPAIIESAGPGGHVVLHLAGVHAAENIDNVQVFFLASLPLADESVKYAKEHAASLILESEPQSGSDRVFDVTPVFSTLLRPSPLRFDNFTVAFVQVPKNNGVRQTDESFSVDWTYFEIFNAKGEPVPQARHEPKYN